MQAGQASICACICLQLFFSIRPSRYSERFPKISMHSRGRFSPDGFLRREEAPVRVAASPIPSAAAVVPDAGAHALFQAAAKALLLPVRCRVPPCHEAPGPADIAVKAAAPPDAPLADLRGLAPSPLGLLPPPSAARSTRLRPASNLPGQPSYRLDSFFRLRQHRLRAAVYSQTDSARGSSIFARCGRELTSTSCMVSSASSRCPHNFMLKENTVPCSSRSAWGTPAGSVRSN